MFKGAPSFDQGPQRTATTPIKPRKPEFTPETDESRQRRIQELAQKIDEAVERVKKSVEEKIQEAIRLKKPIDVSVDVVSDEASPFGGIFHGAILSEAIKLASKFNAFVKSLKEAGYKVGTEFGRDPEPNQGNRHTFKLKVSAPKEGGQA